MNYKIIIPYRARPQHVAAWRGVKNVLFVEQSADGKPFNRGKLLNIGALQTTAEYLIFNDIDMLPTTLPPALPGVTQLASSEIQLIDYLGGSTMFHRQTFLQAGGYRNDYWHRAEDNEMRFNLRRLGIAVNTHRLQFVLQPHTRPTIEFDAALWALAQQPRRGQNLAPLLNCKYDILSKHKNWITVKL